MEPIRQHTGKAYPLYRANIDTDQIIPKQFLKRIERQGFGQFLFYNWRFDENDNPREDFSMNDPKYQDVSILIAGENFGCGSSREHAPWAIQDYGFRVVIAPSFADIFSNNCTKNGILPIELPDEIVSTWAKEAESDAGASFQVDLENKTVTGPDGQAVTFEIADYRREMLLNGWDEISVTLTLDDKISQYEEQKV
ncbi:3-isopropylmalate dehydratase small subunit [Salisediminibacterium beveridgei]|uniref:3-isopropylmalate dehydratase small subunit n=1 Tax=Salisediminibacterium beveridgei TaxID=632773 RepID=A0A1D7QTR6_9BACI|nr:3-isopropylmalate dehydratase small subunit [Salisediminibacterium beveridgei]AOM82412.1 3-isopropylmalate dehydratase small subunit [Salisediminibacterium beveridgei]